MVEAVPIACTTQRMLSFLRFIHLPSFAQIIEDVQNFYTSKYNDNNNGTLIITYQKIVSVKSSISSNTMFLMQQHCCVGLNTTIIKHFPSHIS